jgi:hypothetical protein
MKMYSKIAIVTVIVLSCGLIFSAEKSTDKAAGKSTEATSEKMDLKAMEDKASNGAPKTFPKQPKEAVLDGCKKQLPKGSKKDIDNCVQFVTDRMKQ